MGETSLAVILFGLIVIGLLNTLLSLFYYINVLKVMALDKPLEEVEGRPIKKLAVPFLPNGYAIVLAAVVFVIGLFWDPLARACIDTGVNRFHPITRIADWRFKIAE